jgi:DNA-directed RNA polymerase subunit RPC12/RpoP
MKQYKCNKCGKMYGQNNDRVPPQDIDEHLSSWVGHPDDKQYFCSSCLYDFLDKIYTNAGFKLEEIK